MGLGFIFVLMGMVWSFLGWAFSLPVWLLLSYLVKVVELFSSFSFSIYFLKISWPWLIIYYFILWIFIWRFDKKQKLNQVKKSELF